MKTKNVIEGLLILSKYRKDDDGYDVGAEHDAIYSYATDAILSTSDIERMIELGWFQEVDCVGEDFSVSDYDKEEGWVAYVWQ